MKYQLTKTSKTLPDGTIIRQIKWMEDIPAHGIKKGDLGGWLKSRENYPTSSLGVVRGGVVSGIAVVSGGVVSGGEIGGGWVCGGEVSGGVVSGGEVSSGWVSGNNDLLLITPIGRDNGALLAVRTADGGIICTRGCFAGTIEELDAASLSAHVGEYACHRPVYVAAIALIKAKFGGEHE